MDTAVKIVGIVRDLFMILLMVIFLILGIRTAMALNDVASELNKIQTPTQEECVGELLC